MIVFLLGLSVFLPISDAFVMQSGNAQEEQKSITMFINGQNDNQPSRRQAAQKRHRRRNSEDVLEDLYNNAADSEDKHHGPEMRSQHHGDKKLRSIEMDFGKIVKGVINYFTKSPVLVNARSNLGEGGETKVDLVKLVNGAFNYLASLNPKYRANSIRPKHLEPRQIELRSKNENSLLYEINTKKIVEDVTDILSSKSLKGYVDTIARKAATIYRAVTNDN